MTDEELIDTLNVCSDGHCGFCELSDVVKCQDILVKTASKRLSELIMKMKDTVEVVRCKDCKNYEVNGIKGYSCMSKGDNWFCADGERREDNSDGKVY